MARKRKPESVRNCIVISDTHGGCGLGLFTLKRMRLDDGGWYYPSRAQRQVASWWREFWDERVPAYTHGEPYVVVFNGDAIDGVHHNSIYQWTHNLETQSEQMYRELAPVVDRAEAYYHIRGTEAHVGPSGIEEERLAKRLGAVPNADGQYARWDLWLRLDFALCHFTHHIGTAGSMAYESSALMRELSDSFVECAKSSKEIPDVVCRSHRHRNIEIKLQTDKGDARVFTTAAWQLKTPFVYRVAGARQSMPQIGGSAILCSDTECYTRHFTNLIDRPKEERPVIHE